MRLIYLSPVTWNSFSQRPHELVQYFHQQTHGKVLWIDPYPTRFPNLEDVLIKRPKSDNMVSNIPSWLTVIKPRVLPIEPVPFSGLINSLFWHDSLSEIERFTDGSTILGIGKPSTFALSLLSKKVFASSFYDAMDDFPAFYHGLSQLAMINRERRTVTQVSKVLVSSSALRDRLQHLTKSIHLVLNACASDRLPEVSTIQQHKNVISPVFGYIGTIAEWFDWQLVVALAESYPRAKFRLIGPIYKPSPISLPKNIFLEPPVPHAIALKTMTEFDIGLIPFKKTILTSSVDPIKYYEYRALGLPVLSTAFGEMLLRDEIDGTFLIDKSLNAEVIQRALIYNTSLDAIIKFRKNNSWKYRFDQARIFTL